MCSTKKSIPERIANANSHSVIAKSEKGEIKMLKRAIVSILPFLLLGCATTASVKKVPTEIGEKRIFEAEFAEVVEAAQFAVAELGMETKQIQTSESAFALLAEKPASLFSWGELIRVSVEKGANGNSVVRVLTKRRLATNVTAKGDWSEEIFAEIAKRLSR